MSFSLTEEEDTPIDLDLANQETIKLQKALAYVHRAQKITLLYSHIAELLEKAILGERLETLRQLA
jgi:hypothetical protein